LFTAELKQFKKDFGTLPRQQKKKVQRRMPTTRKGYLWNLPILSQLHQLNESVEHSGLYKSTKKQATNRLSVWVGSRLQLRVEMLQTFLMKNQNNLNINFWKNCLKAQQ